MKNLIYLASIIILISSCKKEKEEHGVPNTITTVTNTTTNSVTLTVTGNIYSTANMQEWGIKYGAEEPYHYQTYFENASIQGNSVTFSITISGLEDSTQYFFLPYCYFESPTLLYSEDTIRASTSYDPNKIGLPGPGGGMIFYTDGNGGGMEMSTVPRIGSWVNASPSLPGCIKDFGAGKSNTELMVNNIPVAYAAATKCYNLVEGGYDDWFLPSQDELLLIHENLCELGHFSPETGYYVSSTQSLTGTTNCMGISLSLGSAYSFSKTMSMNYVAVREF